MNFEYFGIFLIVVFLLVIIIIKTGVFDKKDDMSQKHSPPGYGLGPAAAAAIAAKKSDRISWERLAGAYGLP
jgi:hypothetical protein